MLRRINLAQDLWASISDEELSVLCPLTDEQMAEINRRVADIDSRKAKLIPWEEVCSQLLRDDEPIDDIAVKP